MYTIRNIEQLKDLLSEEQLQLLDEGGRLHRQYSNIKFKIHQYSPHKELVVRVWQGQSLSRNYADAKVLRERTKELFQGMLPEGLKLHVHASPYTISPPSEVNAKWLQAKMFMHHTQIKHIAADTGLSRTRIQKYLSGELEMGKAVRAMFYYYFAGKAS